MLVLEHKTILLISPQSWGKMFVSKHHYAVELAKKGNRVFFLNPPNAALKERVQVTAVSEIPGLSIISHRLNFPYYIKFHAIGIFHWLMRRQVKKILAAINTPVDIIWSFDLGNLYPFRLFPGKALRIFHPVDEPLNSTAIDAAQDAAVIFSVTHEILDKYKAQQVPRHFINHGVSETFFKTSATGTGKDDKIHVGFSGNLLRKDIDRDTFLQIIQQNPEVIFDCWGNYKAAEDNIGGTADAGTLQFIETLLAISNVRLHGAVSHEQLIAGYSRADAFLICYDINKDQSKGTNYHKIMEFLSTGKVVISNNVTTYQQHPELLRMPVERNSNKELPSLFSETLQHLEIYNSVEAMRSRKAYASANLYSKQLQKIEALL